MKAYLWTMFVLYVMAFVSEIRKKPGHINTETHSSLVIGVVLSMALLTWTGYLLWTAP